MTRSPGWYVDPDNDSQMRWWDGTRWIERTAPRLGGPDAPPPQPDAPPVPLPPPPQPDAPPVPLPPPPQPDAPPVPLPPPPQPDAPPFPLPPPPLAVRPWVVVAGAAAVVGWLLVVVGILGAPTTALGLMVVAPVAIRWRLAYRRNWSTAGVGLRLMVDDMRNTFDYAAGEALFPVYDRYGNRLNPAPESQFGSFYFFAGFRALGWLLLCSSWLPVRDGLNEFRLMQSQP